jgi:uncharacterized protein YeaO (DUF488 family)
VNAVIRTKCVKTEIDPVHDGLRILVTRFTIRGCPRTRYDVWMPNLGPSEPLLRDWLARRISWEVFSVRYKAEIFEEAPVDRGNKRIKNHGQKYTLRLIKLLALRGPVTLLCGCAEDEGCCHRHLLKGLIEQKGL